jgi:DNA polymerase-1
MPIVCANCGLEATKHTCKNFNSFWTEDKCQVLIEAFYVKYYGIMEDRRKIHAIARKYGYIWDMWGRIMQTAGALCYLPYIVAEVLRGAANFPYQAGAQSTIKLVMAQAHDEFTKSKMYAICKPVLQIHDELLFLVKRQFAREIGEYLVSLFENCCELRVPIKAGMAIADTWGALVK